MKQCSSKCNCQSVGVFGRFSPLIFGSHFFFRLSSFGNQNNFDLSSDLSKTITATTNSNTPSYVYKINSQKQTNEYKLWLFWTSNTKRFQDHSSLFLIPFNYVCYVTIIKLIFKEPFFVYNGKHFLRKERSY